MREDFGNLWTYPAQVRVITTNGFIKTDGTAVMGRGCAREACDRFPGLAADLGRQLRVHGNVVVGLRPDLWTFPVKHKWMDVADPWLITQSAGQLRALVDLLNIDSVVLPRPGCGNGRLEWDEVRPLLAGLDDRFTCITFA